MGHQVNWDKVILYVLIAALSIYLIEVLKDFRPKTEIVLPFDNAEVNKLTQEKDSLVNELTKLQEEFKKITEERINNINNHNDGQVDKINRISTYNNTQRDSLWSILFTSKDSLPQRYWDLLKQRAGTKSP